MKFYTTSRISENIHKTPEGYLACNGVSIARSGEMIYGVSETPIQPGPDGKVYIVRKPEEVFRPESIASYEAKSICILHPEGEKMVTPVTWKELTVGVLHNVRRGTGEQENDLVGDLLITDQEAIDLVLNGLREVSCGYEADYFETGVGRGEQKNIIGNHLALVPQGRAGSSYAINDHNGKGSQMKFTEILAALKGKKFPKAEVEQLRAVANDSALVEQGSVDEKAPCSMGDMKKYFDEAMAKFGKKEDQPAGDMVTPPAPGKPAMAMGDEPAPAKTMEERMAALEAAIAKILKAEGAEAEVMADGDEEVEMEESTEDASDGEEEIEVEDAADADEEAEEKGKKKTGDKKTVVVDAGPEDEEDMDDVASRAEILAPGIKVDQKNLKAKALKKAYATTDGKAAIDVFTKNFEESVKNKDFVDAVFVGVSEVLKTKRTNALAQSRTFDFKSVITQPKGAMTAEEVNAANQKFYAKK